MLWTAGSGWDRNVGKLLSKKAVSMKLGQKIIKVNQEEVKVEEMKETCNSK